MSFIPGRRQRQIYLRGAHAIRLLGCTATADLRTVGARVFPDTVITYSFPDGVLSAGLGRLKMQDLKMKDEMTVLRQLS